MNKKIEVGILGATGMVGQKFIDLLRDHPWFEITCLAASDNSREQKYSERMNTKWKMINPISPKIADMIIKGCKESLPAKMLFSGLDSSVAGDIEEFYAKDGHIVISNSKNHRMDKDAPLLIPEINADHLDLLKYQQNKGKIITNPNCAVIGMALALAPIQKTFGIDKVTVTTMQAVSGAGYPGTAALDILGNVIPYIHEEEEKIETETLKIFGRLVNEVIESADIKISASCNRVAVVDGHTECISFSLKRKAGLEEIKEEIKKFNPLKDLNLPSAPNPPIIIMEDVFRPQPCYDIGYSGGMAVVIGRIRKCPVLDYKMTILSHNTVRGAAGAAILNAELLKAKGLI